jgi:glycosyltransferase involved in cell wall biosynthesis
VSPPLVTVALPVHNGERWLVDCVHSVLRQTMPDLELVIADAGSTDGTERLCRELAAGDARIRYLRSDAYRGLTDNHMAALDAARGEFFCWIAADDAMQPTLVERCLAGFADDPRAVFVAATSARVDPEWHVDCETPADESYRDDVLTLTARRPWRRFVNAIRHLHECNAFSALFRTDELRAAGPLAAYPGSDRVLLASAVLRGPALQLPDRLMLRRVHPDQVSRALGDDRAERVFDRSLPGRAYVESVNLFVEHLRAIRSSPAPLYDRLMCVGAMLTVWWVVRRFYLPAELSAWRARRRARHARTRPADRTSAS